MSPSSVNPALTPNRRTTSHPTPRPTRHRRVVENDDYAVFVRRIINSYGIRIASGDIEGLTALADLGHLLDDALEHAIHGLHDAGHSWADIGARLGITRQATHQRWGGEPG